MALLTDWAATCAQCRARGSAIASIQSNLAMWSMVQNACTACRWVRSAARRDRARITFGVMASSNMPMARW